MQRELRKTADGSATIFVPHWDEHYHSVHGALQESKHVFITHGLQPFAKSQTLNILEMGFGTGLNALLTCVMQPDHQKITYTALEAYPVEEALWQGLQYGNLLVANALFEQLHQSVWGTPTAITPNFTLLKLHSALENYVPKNADFDVIYYDAFAPSAQPELWTTEVFQKLFEALKPGGILVTYCAKGQVKRNLKAAGFNIEALPGPPGKREMTRAKKPAA